MLLKFMTLFLFLLVLPAEINSSKSSQTWIKSGYWYAGSDTPVSMMNSALFNHLICAFVFINSSTSELSISSGDEPSISTFSNIVKKKNPWVTTLLSIWAGDTTSSRFFSNSSTFLSMVNQPSHRKNFIESSIKTARLHGYEGLDLLADALPNMNTNMTNMGTFFDEWRAAINLESKNSSQSLILTIGVHYSPVLDSASYPVDSIRRNFDWVHVIAYDYHLPSRENFTGAHAALHDPSTQVSSDYGIKKWIKRGLPANKMVIGLPYHGYAWTLKDPKNGAIGAAARGLAVDGSMSYGLIKWYMRKYEAAAVYNATYVVNCFTSGSLWVGYDDVDAIRTKVAYAKEKGLRGYNVWQLPNDDNWVLSKTAAQEGEDYNIGKRWLVIALPTIAIVTLVLGVMCYLNRRALKSKVKWVIHRPKRSLSSNVQVFSFSDIKEATSNFSGENKLGEGGYGPVYKGKLLNGQEIAVKRLSLYSRQGLDEFENEVNLTAKLQHVNLVRLLGFCTEREENMLIYEYMPNKSLDFYLFDPTRRPLLDWEKRVHIIEGITQGLLYLQEYSRLTIIHRDLKGGNILLDAEMKPKISDFGIARSFQKDEHEARTGHIVGTYGYVPPEYVERGIYSRKYDVYSFGVLILQIISGKKTRNLYGPFENLNVLDYAYDMWKDGRGMEFMDPSLDDSSSTCKLITCMHVALLCVQEKWTERPSMLKVSSMLKNETVALPIPERPAFSTQKDAVREDKLTLPDEFFSVDDATISQLVPR